MREADPGKKFKHVNMVSAACAESGLTIDAFHLSKNFWILHSLMS